MTVAAATIIADAHTILFDPDGTRWPATELVGYLDLAQLKIVEARPDQYARVREVTLAPGYRQTLADDIYALLDIPNNATGQFKRITKTDMVKLDMVLPGWRKRPATVEIVHFMHNLNEPRSFYVYPPAQAGSKVELLAAEYPPHLPAATGPKATSVTGNIVLGDKWRDALFNFVMFKAYLKDAEYGGNPALAAAYKDLFIQATGVELQTTTSNASPD
mgnify:CR=1 FL=1